MEGSFDEGADEVAVFFVGYLGWVRGSEGRVVRRSHGDVGACCESQSGDAVVFEELDFAHWAFVVARVVPCGVPD